MTGVGDVAAGDSAIVFSDSGSSSVASGIECSSFEALNGSQVIQDGYGCTTQLVSEKELNVVQSEIRNFETDFQFQDHCRSV